MAKTPLKVLYLEDDPNDVELVAATLESEGFACDITHVDNRDDYITALERGGYDVILSDYNLPAFDGLSALALAREKYPDVPLILISGAIGEERAIEAMKSGATDYVLKQRPGRLATSLRRALREAEERTQRKQAEHTLRAVIDAVPTLINAKDSQCRYIFINRYQAELYGVTAESAIGKTAAELLNAEYGDYTEKLDRQVLETGQAIPFYEESYADAQGVQRTFITTKVPLGETTGQVNSVATIALDITERKRAEGEMRKLSRALAQTADAVLITDRRGVIEYVNPAFEGVTGYGRAETLGQTPKFIQSGRHGQDFYRQLWDTILGGRVFRDVFINRKKDGSLYYEEKTITPLTDDSGEISHFISTGKDITERMQTEERLHYLAHHDVLTDLPNRNLLLERLEQTLMRASWRDRVAGVLFLDLDRFKVINDTLGHDVGDQLLQAVAARLKTCVRPGDTVARFGGDEFAILLTDVARTRDIAPVAQTILDAFTQPLDLQGREVFVTTSIGVSVYPNDGQDAATILKNADTAMYRAKDHGRNAYRFYTAEMNARAMERLNLETDLRRALERNEYVLHYQPQIDMQTGHIIGAEALIRWQHPDKGLVPPLDFIPLLEETGLVAEVGQWVLRTACEQARAWGDAGSPICVAVNLSPRQFRDRGLQAIIKGICEESGIEPHRLELEITESMIMKEGDASLETLHALQALGFQLAIDDFGTGYSSLAYLKRFPIHTLKIDREFIRDLTVDSHDAAIVSAVISLAKGFGLRVVAEGVETIEQWHFLRSQKCAAMQGYLISRPVPADEMTSLLRQGYAWELPKAKAAKPRRSASRRKGAG